MFGRQHNLHNVQHSGRVVQARSYTIGCSAAVSGLSADFTAGSSQLMHWRSVRPERVTTGTIRFPHFGQRVVRSMRSSRFCTLTRNWNFCSIRAFRSKQEDSIEGALVKGALVMRSCSGHAALAFQVRSAAAASGRGAVSRRLAPTAFPNVQQP